jgi:iron complex transport system substrate-binding protein
MANGRTTFLSAALAAGLACAPAQAQPVSFRDMENREVTLAGPAQRIASIPIPLASTLIALDQGPRRLVGMNAIAKSAILEGILGRVFPETKTIPSDIVGANFAPNVEALASVRPDLVLQWGGRGNDIVAPLSNAGLNVALILCCREEWTRFYHDMLAGAIGRADRARENTAWRDRVLGQLAAKRPALATARKPRVLHLQQALTQLTAAGKGTYNEWIIEQAGGENAAGGNADFKAINVEQIALWDPEVILLNSFEDRLTPARIYDDPILSLTRAAREKRVYKMPLGGYRWDPPSHESPLTWMWLANLLHPELFSFDLRAEMRAAYRTLYGHDLTAADIDEILRISTQGGATHYAQFRAR